MRRCRCRIFSALRSSGLVWSNGPRAVPDNAVLEVYSVTAVREEQNVPRYAPYYAPSPAVPGPEKKLKYHYEEVGEFGRSASFPVAPAPDVVVIIDDDDEEEDDDTFRLQRPHPLILSHLYNDDDDSEDGDSEDDE